MAAPCPGAALAACPGKTPHSVGVVFELRRAETRPGETLMVAGAGRELGDWATEDTCGLQLRTSVSVYPTWAMLSPVWIEPPEGQEELRLEYKYIRDLGPWGHAGHRIAWEDGIGNRLAKIPCKRPGVWVVSDAVWGSEGVPEIRRTLESEVSRRRDMFDPDPIALLATVPRLPLAPTKALRGRPQLYSMTPETTSPRHSDDSYAIEAEYDRLPLGSSTSTPSVADWGRLGPPLARSASSGSEPEAREREQSASPEVAGRDLLGEIGELRAEIEELQRQNDELRASQHQTELQRALLQRRERILGKVLKDKVTAEAAVALAEAATE